MTSGATPGDETQTAFDDHLPAEEEWDMQHLLDDYVLGACLRDPGVVVSRRSRTSPRLPERVLEGAVLPTLRRSGASAVYFSTLYLNPFVARVDHPCRGRLLLIGDVRGGTELGTFHRRIDLLIDDRWRAWETLECPMGELVLRDPVQRARMKAVPHVEGQLGRSIIEVDGRALPTYTSWFARTPRGPVVLPRELWETFEPKLGAP